jgi:RimJ/RimL family protein N-acetyltransferase
VRFPDDVPVLGDGVVTLRAHTPADVDAVLEQCTDLVSQRWTTVPVPYTREDAERFVHETVPAHWAESHWTFAVEAADDGGQPRFCGTVELRDEGNRRAEIAFGAHPWARGRGIIEAALRLLLEWGFHEQRLRTVVWWANAGNWASRRVAWKLGFSFDGTIERWLPQRGDLLDAWVGVLHVDDEQAPRGEWLSVPRILGDRVVLRGFRESDAERVAQACDDERSAHWFWRMPHPYTLDDAVAYIEARTEQLATANGITWAVADPSTDELVGAISAFDLKPGREAELGYWTHPEARGRGVMTEACGLVVRHCLTPYERGGLGLQRLFVGAAAGNDASIHVIEANGFTLVSRERRALRLRDGSLVDQLGYDLLAEELD